jgi:hypothetical protein
MVTAGLRLEVVAYEGPTRWRWVLTGPNGQFLASHEVRLNPYDWQYDALGNLNGLLRWRPIPDRRIADEAQIVADVGDWISDQVLGPVGPALLAARPATVRVIVPAEATWIAFCPLELAYVGGGPIAAQEVTLAMQPGAGKIRSSTQPARRRLRVLGLFSLPSGGRALNLRRERQALLRIFAGIGADRAVDVRVLQYGVTRARLTEVLGEAGGWDVIHISGHGAPGNLVLETADGAADTVNGAELAALLASAREHVKLVTVSACWSGALAPGRPPQSRPVAAADGSLAEDDAREHGQPGLQALATELVDQLDCAVLAMRYPVADDFSVALAEKLYGALAGAGRPLPRALGMALHELAEAFPPLSTATPTLFGARAAEMHLAAPLADQADHPASHGHKLAGFPPQPDSFVGRTEIMTRSSAVLAPDNDLSGVLLLGMPGGGKSACALELAYTHEHVFDRLIWFRVPEEGEYGSALAGLANALERWLPGLRIAHLLEHPGQLQAFLLTLTEVWERQRVLVVIDHIESLLTEHGQWRDALWGQVIDAMTAQKGAGRVVLTSRRRPPTIGTRVRTEPVGPLTEDETQLLAREMPGLRLVFEGRLPGLDAETSQVLARNVRDVAHGHPALLELASAQASDSDYLRVLEEWTIVVSADLSLAVRELFWFLCCAEADDRVYPVLAASWEDLRQRLGRQGSSAGLSNGLAGLVGLGLVSAPSSAGDPSGPFEVHPVVAAAGRAQAADGFLTVVETELAAYWTRITRHGMAPKAGDPATTMVIRAGLSAARYLLRLHRFSEAGEMIEQVLTHDQSMATATTVLPLCTAIVEAASGTAEEPAAIGLLALALETLDPAQAEQCMRDSLASAHTQQNHRLAAITAANLFSHCLRTQRLTEALRLAEDLIGHVHQAGLGPWTKLSAIGMHLQVRLATGEAKPVLDAVKQLCGHMQALPVTSDEPEIAKPWNVREMMSECGRDAAMQLREWDVALEMNAAAVASKRVRGAPDTLIAASRFNDYAPLILLGRADEARELLIQCREVFERARDVQMVGKVLSALALTEMQRAHTGIAAELEADALRFKYRDDDVDAIQVSHHNLGNYLFAGEDRQDEALAHHLAAALIGVVTGGARTESSVASASAALRMAGDAGTIPETMAALDDATKMGVAALLVPRATDSRALQNALTELIARVKDTTAAPAAEVVAPRDRAAYLAGWDPAIAGMLAASRGDTEAGEALQKCLAYHRNFPSWVPLADMLRRIAAGENDPDLGGLSERNVLIAVRALDALAGKVHIPVELWPAMPFGLMLADVVAAADGNEAAAAAARRGLAMLAADPRHAALSSALERIISGERDPSLRALSKEPVDRAVVAMVLHHLGSGYGESKLRASTAR